MLAVMVTMTMVMMKKMMMKITYTSVSGTNQAPIGIPELGSLAFLSSGRRRGRGGPMPDSQGGAWVLCHLEAGCVRSEAFLGEPEPT